MSGPFGLHWGNRQGCPLSPLLFALALEPLAARFQDSHGIVGFRTKIICCLTVHKGHSAVSGWYDGVAASGDDTYWWFWKIVWICYKLGQVTVDASGSRFLVRCQSVQRQWWFTISNIWEYRFPLSQLNMFGWTYYRYWQNSVTSALFGVNFLCRWQGGSI